MAEHLAAHQSGETTGALLRDVDAQHTLDVDKEFWQHGYNSSRWLILSTAVLPVTKLFSAYNMLENRNGRERCMRTKRMDLYTPGAV